MTKTTTYSKSALYGVDDSAQIVPTDTDEGEAAFDVELIGLKTEGAVSSERLEIRKELVRQLRLAPDSFFAYWQILALETGCRHACALCAQETSTTLTSFTREGLEDILSAILTVATERRRNVHNAEGKHRAIVGYGFTTYRPGIIKRSHDNDSGDSLLLADAIRHIHENFGVKSRLSMVAYSRHDEQLQLMHERIVRHQMNAVDSVRFSFSSHPLGWRQNRDGYLIDFANMLRTWKPFVDEHRGSGRYHGAVTEFRMDPDIETLDAPLDDDFVLGHHIVRFGPVLLISTEQRVEMPPLNSVIGVEGRSATFRDALLDYTRYTSDALIRSEAWRTFAEDMISKRELPPPNLDCIESWGGHHFCMRRGGLALLANCDGPFYAFEPTFQEDGTYVALNLYHQTQSRRRSGLFDETRWGLNALLRYKSQVGIPRRHCFPEATWDDVEGFVQEIQQSVESTRCFDLRSANYIERHVVPLVSAYVDVLKLAGYPPEFVFDPNFTYLSGPLYNLGRAVRLFRGLVSKSDEPVTAAEMREYYLTYRYEPPTRLSPIPLLLDGELPTSRITGTKYRRAASGHGAAVFEQLNRVGMRPTSSLFLKGLVSIMRRRSSAAIPSQR